MVFDGSEGGSISLEEAASLTLGYRKLNGTANAIGSFLGSESVKGLLDQPGCVGIRMYFAKGENGNTLVAVGVDANGNDLLTGTSPVEVMVCLPDNGKSNPLNS